ncbi:MAG: ATP-binding protein [Synergistaceae bacterium]|nr:ATP-binding protein [Synergistaceae bacterium]
MNEIEKMLDQLRAAEYDIMKYKLTSDALNIALWDMDVVSGDPVNPNNKFVWSQEFRQMLGFSDKNDFPDLLHSWSDRLHPEDSERTLDAFAAHMNDHSGRTPYDIEYRLMMKNGNYRHFRALGATLRGDAGIPVRVAGALMDITEKKQTEEKARRAEIAEESSKAKSRFLATISHEIRTPMNTILGITEIQLQDDALEPKYKEAFSRIYKSSNLLLSIVNDLLDMSKIDADKLELIPVRYETASLINDVVNLNLVRFGSKPLEFELQVDENTPKALIGDDLRIKQILNNLLSNSFKYTKKGMVKLSVSAETGNPATLVLRVNDTGQGMTEEQVGKLFDEYSRFNTEANRITEGTGLGMHITRSLVHTMGGEIHVKSEPGIGTAFTVRLPQENLGAGVLGREVTENLRRFRESETALKKAQVIREPMPYGRVLVVDDADLNLYVAKGLLAPYELSIDTADSGFKAIDRIESGNEYDIVFMDYMMPEMDGIETLKAMRGMGYSRPVVALTADAVSGRAEMFLKSGFDDFISKPIDIRHLDSVLKKFVRDRQPREVVEAARKEKNTRKAEAGTAEATFLDAVKKIGTVNTEIGLSRVSGMEDMYYDILELFHKKLPRECDAMSAFMSAPDMKGFSIAVHSMKSQLSTIGAMALSETAQKLETASKDDSMDYCTEHFPAFKENLLVLHARLSAVFPGKEAALVKKEPGDHAYLSGHIQKTLAAVNDFDSDAAIEAINQLRIYDYGEETDALLNEALAALDDFDFDTAADILGKIKIHN